MTKRKICPHYNVNELLIQPWKVRLFATLISGKKLILGA